MCAATRPTTAECSYSSATRMTPRPGASSASPRTRFARASTGRRSPGKAKELARKQDSASRKWARDRKRDRKPEAAIDDVLDAATRAAGNIVSLPFGAQTHATPELEVAAEAADARDAMDEPDDAPRRAAGMSDFELFRQFQQLQEEADD